MKFHYLFFGAIIICSLSCKKSKDDQVTPTPTPTPVIPFKPVTYLKAAINGRAFSDSLVVSDSYYYNSNYVYTNLRTGAGRDQEINFTFYPTSLHRGSFPISGWQGGTPVMAVLWDFSHMTDPENPPHFYAQSGNITITELDTGTVSGNHGVFINLEATFNFSKDTVNVENGIISYHLN
jgi:hypothetical protein